MPDLQTKVAMDFVLAYRSLVEPGVLKDALRNNDKDLSLAIGQIHHKSLETNKEMSNKDSSIGTKSFKEALLQNPVPSKEKLPLPNRSPNTNHARK